MDGCLPGSRGEHALQEQLGSADRARAFYRNQMRDHLNPWMQRFIAEQEMVFVGSADTRGECDCSLRAGPQGFVRVLDARTLAYPEYRGNGVYASLGNIAENPRVGMLFVDFFRHTVGLHVNGRAEILSSEDLRRRYPMAHDVQPNGGAAAAREAERWVVVGVEEAYVHCSKHIPLLAKLNKEIDWGTDDPAKKRGDYFRTVRCEGSAL